MANTETLTLSVLHQEDVDNPGETIDVPEIFYTLQGEGRSLGMPATFVRTSECNLQCEWCDTPQTWNWAGSALARPGLVQFKRHEEQVALPVEDVAERMLATGADRYIFSGGEPMIQQAAIVGTLVVARAMRLESGGPPLIAEIETNGTRPPQTFTIGGKEYSTEDQINQWNISPKLSSSGNDPRKAIKIPVLKHYAQLDNAGFKFVIGTVQDQDDAERVISDAGIAPGQVWIMPEGRTGQELKDKLPWLAEYCKTNKFNLTTRLHIDIWGDKKGV